VSDCSGMGEGAQGKLGAFYKKTPRTPASDAARGRSPSRKSK
jgi:hypothetical protein